MELDELKQRWQEYDRKLDNSLKMNQELFRQLRLDKAHSKLGRLMAVKRFELAIQFVMVFFLIRFNVIIGASIPYIMITLVLLGFVLIGILLTMRQMQLITRIKSGYDEAIAPLQRKLETLKLLLIRYVQLSYIPLPLSPLFVVLGARVWFGYDFFATGNAGFWRWCFLVVILLIPLVAGLVYQLNQKKVKPFWVKSFLAGAGWNQIVAAQTFLNEIEDFEKEV